MKKNNKIVIFDNTDEDKTRTVFCKECEDIGLNEFGLDPNTDEFVKAMEQHKICKEIGRFNGDICSRVFIASTETPDLMCYSDEEESLV